MIGGAGLFLRYVRQRTDRVLVEAQDRSSCLASTETKHFEDKAEIENSANYVGRLRSIRLYRGDGGQGLRYGSLASRKLREGFGHHDKNQVKTCCRAHYKPRENPCRYRQRWRRMAERDRKIAGGNRQGRVNSARYGTCCLGSQ